MQPAEIIASQGSTAPTAPVARDKIADYEMSVHPDADGFEKDFVFGIDWYIFPEPDGNGKDIIKLAYFVYGNHRCAATAPTGAINNAIEIADARG